MDRAGKLERLLQAGVKLDEPMALHTSWKAGGPADFYVSPADAAEVAAVIRFCREQELPLFVFGNGTNLLVREGGWRGVMMKIGFPFQYLHRKGSLARAGAGCPMPFLARATARRGLAGLEFAGGIPGSLGGALVMNAGAFGGYVGSLVREVVLVDWNGAEHRLPAAACGFGYRRSSLARAGVVLEATLELQPGNAAELESRVEAFLERRLRRHPRQPSAGSVFRNPPDRPAGRLIEEAGGKGMQIGGARVSERHANFIVNRGGATATDIIALIEAVQKLVRKQFGIELQPEVRIIGEES